MPAPRMVSSIIGNKRSACPDRRRSNVSTSRRGAAAPCWATATDTAAKQLSKARMYIVLDDARHLLECKARPAWPQLWRIAKAKVAQEIRFHVRAGEELLVNARIVKARHRTRIQ